MVGAHTHTHSRCSGERERACSKSRILGLMPVSLILKEVEQDTACARRASLWPLAAQRVPNLKDLNGES